MANYSFKVEQVNSDTCSTGKIKYKDRKVAKKSGMYQRNKGLKIRSIYYCDKCFGYHLSSNTPSKETDSVFY